MPTQTHPVTPPHVSIKALRLVSGLTVEQLAQKVADVLGLDSLNRGTISAIETGKKGASRQMLDAIAAAYEIDPALITTDYDPRSSKIHKVPA